MSQYMSPKEYGQTCIMLLPMFESRVDKNAFFEDCFLSEDQENIIIYNRIGGNYRNCNYGEAELMSYPNFVKTFDDPTDLTMGFYVFDPPAQWFDDFILISHNRQKEVSDEYYDHVVEFFPELVGSGYIEAIFGRDS